MNSQVRHISVRIFILLLVSMVAGCGQPLPEPLRLVVVTPASGIMVAPPGPPVSATNSLPAGNLPVDSGGTETLQQPLAERTEVNVTYPLPDGLEDPIVQDWVEELSKKLAPYSKDPDCPYYVDPSLDKEHSTMTLTIGEPGAGDLKFTQSILAWLDCPECKAPEPRCPGTSPKRTPTIPTKQP